MSPIFSCQSHPLPLLTMPTSSYLPLWWHIRGPPESSCKPHSEQNIIVVIVIIFIIIIRRAPESHSEQESISFLFLSPSRQKYSVFLLMLPWNSIWWSFLWFKIPILPSSLSHILTLLFLLLLLVIHHSFSPAPIPHFAPPAFPTWQASTVPPAQNLPVPFTSLPYR